MNTTNISCILIFILSFSVASASSSSLYLHFQPKVDFLIHFLSQYQLPVDLFTAWLPRQKQSFSKQLPHKQIKFFKTKSFEEHLENINSIKVYDFSHLKNNSLTSTERVKAVNKLILIDERQDDVALEDILEAFDILPDRSVLVAKFLNNGYVEISQCYRLLDASAVIKHYLFTWHKNMKHGNVKFSMTKNSLNFKATKMDVAIVLTNKDSILHLDDLRDQWNDTLAKVNYGPISRLFDLYNITPSFTVFKDYQFLAEPNISKYLLTVTSPYMTKALLKHVNFMRASLPPKLCFVLRRPPTSFVTTIFTVAFAPSVWYATLAILALLAISLYPLLNIEARRQDIKGKSDYSVYDLLLISLEAVCQQGTSTDPRSYSARILEVFMFMAFMFLYVAYSANILVLLQSTTPLESQSDLHQSGIGFAGMDTDNYQYYNAETAQELYASRINATNRYSIPKGMELVREGLFAFFVESHYGQQYAKYVFTDYEVCSLQELGGTYDYSMGYAGIGKDSGYYEQFKVGLLRIAETGFVHRHYQRYFLPPQCYSKGSSFDPIGIREIYQAILLVVIGTGSGIMVLIIELVLWRVQQSRFRLDKD